jgi:hypothetical protein
MGVVVETSVENVTVTSEVPPTVRPPLTGETDVTRIGAGGAPEVEPAAGTEDDVVEPWAAGDEPLCLIVTNAAPAAARTMTTTRKRRRGVSVTFQRRGA